MGHAARPRTARERFEWPIQCSGTFGGLGGMCGVIITPDDPTLGGAVVGIIGFTVGWTWAWLVQRSE
jgi:hypothetical protein